MSLGATLLLFSLLFSLHGCADLLSSLREENAAIDREYDDGAMGEDDDREADAASRKRLASRLSANNVPSYESRLSRRLASEGVGPSAAPAYVPPAEYKRVTREDFIDRRASENSLWDGQGQNNYLFSQNRQRETGDIVTVDIERELKREIQYQLWMTLPIEQRFVKRVPANAKKPTDGAAKPEGATEPAAPAAAGGNDQKNRDAAEEAAKTNLAGKEENDMKMEVVENLGNGLVRVVGQKRVIYRGISRLVEVTALANGKDVDDSNRIKSSAFLDMKAQVVQ